MINERLVYKSMMLSGVPNFAFLFGYTNISWTLKVDLVATHLCDCWTTWIGAATPP